MKPVLTKDEQDLLIEAIREQEARTSAEIRICITHKFILRPERYAWRMFDQTGMRATRQRNGALIVMMPRMKKVVVLGDCALHAVVSADYWNEAVAAMIRRMHEAGPLAALREGLRHLGDTLSVHWPRQAGDVNELSDEILGG
jgi:putative membrane protein